MFFSEISIFDAMYRDFRRICHFSECNQRNSLASAKFLLRLDFFYKTFQYHRGTSRNRNIGTWVEVPRPHPASRNLRFSDLALAGHAGNYIVLCRPLWEKRPGARQCCGGPVNSFWWLRTITLKASCIWRRKKDNFVTGYSKKTRLSLHF